ncbi:hypothetical protein ACOBWA_01675 [Psychrobacter sp. ER1]|uniref:hypothetical protein n=1 Tax=Psychrobacter sp. ER1 TaxID=3406645 RepID=UPI003B434DC5
MILKKLIPNQLRYSKLSQTVKPLCYAVALSMVALPVNAGRNDLGDLEIYKAAESGGAVLTLMLDTSGSMSTKDFRGGDSRLTILQKALTDLLSKKMRPVIIPYQVIISSVWVNTLWTKTVMDGLMAKQVVS